MSNIYKRIHRRERSFGRNYPREFRARIQETHETCQISRRQLFKRNIRASKSPDQKLNLSFDPFLDSACTDSRQGSYVTAALFHYLPQGIFSKYRNSCLSIFQMNPSSRPTSTSTSYRCVISAQRFAFFRLDVQ